MEQIGVGQELILELARIERIAGAIDLDVNKLGVSGYAL